MNVNLNEKGITADVAQHIEKELASHDTLPELRKEAFENFQRLGLPENKSEEYKDTPIARSLQKNFTFQSPARPGKGKAEEFFIAGMEANVIVFINGFFSKQHSRIISPETQISIRSLAEATAEKNPVVLKHLGKHADFKTDALAAWNTAAWTDGVFLHIQKSQVIETPIVLYYIHEADSEVRSVSGRSSTCVVK